MRNYFRMVVVITAVFLAAFMLIAADVREEIKADSYILIEADTGVVIEDANADTRHNIGYLSKLMSVLLIADDIDSGEYTLNDVLTASNSVTNTKGSVIWLESGDTLSVDELLKSVIIGNANDALTVLAERSAGSVEQFVMDMNARAFDLGLRNTVFESPYGYSGEASFSTAHDVAVICSELLRHDFLQHYFKIWRDFVRNGKVELVSENTLTRTYGAHAGFKACHSDDSGYCIAEAGLSDDGTSFIAVILGSEEADSIFVSAKKLIKKGFNNYRVTDTMFPDEMIRPVLVRGGTVSAVEIGIERQGRAVVPMRTSEMRTKVVIPEYLTAPVRAGQPIGTAAFYNDDKLVFEADIITKSSVPKLNYTFVFRELLVKLIEK